MNKFQNIFLTGFMGVGKSTIGRKLCKKLKLDFVDLDDIIEEKAGQSISEIFSQNGESDFRKFESKCLKEVATRRGQVIALGGGALLENENRSVVNASGTLVYLKASIDVLIDRVRHKAHLRPLLKDKKPEELRTYMIDLFRMRENIYESASLIIMTDDLTQDQVVEKVLAGL